MMKKSSFDIATLISLLSLTGQKVFRFAELRVFVEKNRESLGIPKTLTLPKLVNQLLETGIVEKVDFDFPFRKEVRYCIGNLRPLEKLLHAYPNAYFSHHTAATYNKLLSASLTQLFLNNEQKSIPQFLGELTQEGIDIAFRNKSRITSNTANFDKYLVYLLNGKNTNCLGVKSIVLDSGEEVRITSVERTLIDMVVRPFYSGGPITVLTAFRNAHSMVSVPTMRNLLNQLAFVYPYHQAVGFYLQLSNCYSVEDMNLFRDLGFKFDFYLANAIKEVAYSKDWRMYYPKELLRI